MAIGKQKITKKKNKGKKVADCFLKKEWQEVKAPITQPKNDICFTPVNKSVAEKLSSTSLKGRVFETNLGDLESDEEHANKRFKFIVEEVQGKTCYTNFQGCELVRDKLMQMFKKGITLIECFTEIKTADGFVLRVFGIGFTCKADGQVNKNAKAGSSKLKLLRAKMISEIQNKFSGKKLNDVVQLIRKGKIDTDIKDALNKIRPVNNVCIRKVKMLRRPKLDTKEFMALYSQKSGVQKSKALEQKEEGEAKNLLARE